MLEYNVKFFTQVNIESINLFKYKSKRRRKIHKRRKKCLPLMTLILITDSKFSLFHK